MGYDVHLRITQMHRHSPFPVKTRGCIFQVSVIAVSKIVKHSTLSDDVRVFPIRLPYIGSSAPLRLPSGLRYLAR